MSDSRFVLGLVALAWVGCKRQDAAATDAAAIVATASASASASAPVDTSAPSATATTAPPTPTTTATPSATATAPTTHADIVAPTAGGDRIRLPDGRMVGTDSCPSGYAGPAAADHQCHKTCKSNDECQSASCGNAGGLRVCLAVGAAGEQPTVGMSIKGGDCPRGWAPSVSEANKCDKECTNDAQCGPGNRCKAVGPIGSGKQCQRR